MSIHSRSLAETPGCPPSWLRVERGSDCDLKLRISDCESDVPINWVGHQPRFRIYSQLVDNSVVFETTDPAQCIFETDGIWRLRLTAEQTATLPRGGMRFTLEHRQATSQSESDYLPGLQGGISCRDFGTRYDHAEQASPRLPNQIPQSTDSHERAT